MTGIWPTSDLYWLSAALLTTVDLSALACLVRCVPAGRFRRAGLEITLASLVFWGGLWAAVMANAYIWQWCYCYIFSHTERWLMPVVMALAYGIAGGLIWLFAQRLPWHPVVSFAVLGGLVSLPGHMFAITVRGVMDTPLLESVSPASALVFGIVEFVFYWILIITAGVFARPVYEGISQWANRRMDEWASADRKRSWRRPIASNRGEAGFRPKKIAGDPVEKSSISETMGLDPNPEKRDATLNSKFEFRQFLIALIRRFEIR